MGFECFRQTWFVSYVSQMFVEWFLDSWLRLEKVTPSPSDPLHCSPVRLRAASTQHRLQNEAWDYGGRGVRRNANTFSRVHITGDSLNSDMIFASHICKFFFTCFWVDHAEHFLFNMCRCVTIQEPSFVWKLETLRTKDSCEIGLKNPSRIPVQVGFFSVISWYRMI